MINAIWLGLIVISFVVAAFTGRIDAVTKAAFDGAQLAVEVALGLIGVMTFWLGMMKIAEEAGMVEILAKLVRPLTSRLFPSIPPNHPATGAIVLNLSANLLGLGNAATPMGLIAMKEMQKLNRYHSNTATDAMCTFLALNTSCITLVPTTIMAIRVKFGSANPTEIVGTTIFATFCAMVVALTADFILRKLDKHRRW